MYDNTRVVHINTSKHYTANKCHTIRIKYNYRLTRNFLLCVCIYCNARRVQQLLIKQTIRLDCRSVEPDAKV